MNTAYQGTASYRHGLPKHSQAMQGPPIQGKAYLGKAYQGTALRYKTMPTKERTTKERTTKARHTKARSSYTRQGLPRQDPQGTAYQDKGYQGTILLYMASLPRQCMTRHGPPIQGKAYQGTAAAIRNQMVLMLVNKVYNGSHLLKRCCGVVEVVYL